MNGLRIHRIPAPETPSKPLRVFGCWQLACKHVCDHVLTCPEAEGWAILMPAYAKKIDVSELSSRMAEARRYWDRDADGAPAQWLYDLYSQVIGEALRSAVCSWESKNERCREFLGHSGVLVVVDRDRVRTALLPAYAGGPAPEEPGDLEQLVQCRRANPLPRETGNPGTAAKPRAAGRMKRPKVPPAGGWTEEERLIIRFDLFRDCADRVRTRLICTWKRTGRPDWQTIPMLATMGFAAWRRRMPSGGSGT